jgi:hypothetical protein
MLRKVRELMNVGGLVAEPANGMACAYTRRRAAGPMEFIVMMTIMILDYDVQSLAKVFSTASCCLAGATYLAGARWTVRCRSIRFQPRASSAISRAWMFAEPSPVCQSFA